mgnify:FL=1|tara:strand:+ start:73 stop:1233 length:1161 start_codon:yes stop_codon:yes gene_type:complete
MANNAIEDLLSSEALSEDARTSIQEAWDTKLTEQKEAMKAELREEFSQRYEHDKSQIVEAMDNMLTDAIKAEIEELAEDKKGLVDSRVKYTKSVKEHAGILEKFVTEALVNEVKQLRADRQTSGENFAKLESFIVKNISKELNEFHVDKRAVVEQRVKLVKEGKALIAETKRDFVKKAAEKVEGIVAGALKSEIGALKEDIETAKKNNFGRKIFESFAAEFLTSHLADGTEVKKYQNRVDELETKLSESNETLQKAIDEIKTSNAKIKIAEDSAKREKVLSELLSPLAKGKRALMNELLESVQTDQLRSSYQKYLPGVLNEETAISAKKIQKQNKQKLNENTKEIKESETQSRRTVVTGNKPIHINPDTSDAKAEILNLQKLAGMK